MQYTTEQLAAKAREMRRLCLQMSHNAGAEGAHVGPALSIVDIVTVLYFDVMNTRPDDPTWPDRDRFLLSKGHGVLGLYAPLVMQGVISEQESLTFNRSNTRLAGHPSGKGVHGIEHPSGSLGHGLGIGCGMALAARQDGRPYTTYVLVGDGEADEGSIWEAVMFAAHHSLGNLVCVVDVNGFQYGGATADLMDLSPMEDKWRAFGWNVVPVADGNDVGQLRAALSKSRLLPDTPTCVIAHTVKGHGVSAAVGNEWHHVHVSAEQLQEALAELN